MEEIQNNPSSGTPSFLASRALHDNVDLCKKRKLLDEQLSLPIRKLKFRDVVSGGEHSSLFSGEPEGVKSREMHAMNPNNKVLHDATKSLQPESEMDSNSFVEELDCAMSQYTEAKYEPEFSKAFTDDQHAKSKQDFEVYVCDKPSTSSASCSSNNLENAPIGEENSGFTEDMYNEFGYNADHVYADNGHEGFEGSLDIEPQEMILNPSEMPSDHGEMTSDLFVLSSGRWKINHGAQAGTRKPTIDQEFEQYFSSLML